MTIAQRGSGVTASSGTGSATTQALTVPTGVANDDLWVISLGQANAGTITVPDASFLLIAQKANSTTNQTTVYVKKLLASDAGTVYTFTYSSSTRVMAVAFVVSGVDVSDMASGSYLSSTAITKQQTSSTSRTSSDISPSATDSLLVIAHSERTASGITDTSFTKDAAVTLVGQVSSASTSATNAAGAVYIEQRPSVGATGTRTATANYTNGATFVTLTLKAAGAGSGSAAVTTYLMGQSTSSSSITASGKATTAGASATLQASTTSDFAVITVQTTGITADAQGWMQATLTGLSADTSYYYRFVVGGISDTTVGIARTLATAAKSFKVGFGSCHLTGDTESTVYTSLLAQAPDMFLQLGDFHYSDITTADTTGYRNAITGQFDASSGLKTLVRSVGMHYQWSDHDSGSNNWSPGPGTQTPTANTVYRQIVPHPTLPATDGVYYSFVHGRVRFIMTDSRSYRSDNTATDDASKTMFGATQKAWIKDRLTDSGTVKILCLDVPWIETTTAGSDKWGGFTTERAELYNYANTNGVKLYIIHGDAHSLSADDGTNSPGGIPTACASPFSNNASRKGGPYSQGEYPATGTAISHQYGILSITDTGGSTVGVDYTGKDSTGTTRLSMSTTFSTVVTGAGTPSRTRSVTGTATTNSPGGATTVRTRTTSGTGSASAVSATTVRTRTTTAAGARTDTATAATVRVRTVSAVGERTDSGLAVRARLRTVTATGSAVSGAPSGYRGGRWAAALAGQLAPTFQRETHEWAPLTIVLSGQPYTGAWSWQIVPHGQRPNPAGWLTPVVANTVRGVNIQGLAPSHYWLFYRIDGAAPYVPVPAPVKLTIR